MARWWELLFPFRRNQATLSDIAAVGAPTHSREHGASGTENYGGIIRQEDYNPLLDGEEAVKEYEKMRRSDAQVKATLQVIKLPLRSASWKAIPPEDADDHDRAVADFVNANLFDDDGLDTGWDYVLRHILLQLEFGFSVLEKIWTVDDAGFFRLKRLAPRLPKTVREWHVDEFGQLKVVRQWAPKNGYWGYLDIPAKYCCVFVHEREGDNYFGISMLRSAYKHWFYKEQCYRIDGVRLDRFGVGIPVGTIVEGGSVSKDELDAVEKILKGLRSNERAYLIEKAGKVTFRILTPDGGRGGASDLMASVEHHDQQIARNILAGFLTKDGNGQLGASRTQTLADMFVNALKGVANGISADIKAQIVIPLCDLNFDMNGRQYPSVVAQDLDRLDPGWIMESLVKLVGGQLITMDDDIEDSLRQTLNLPPLAEELKRTTKAARAAAAGQPPIDPATGLPVQPQQLVTGAPTDVEKQLNEQLATYAQQVGQDVAVALSKNRAWRDLVALR